MAQYRTYHAEWEQLVEVAREARLQAIRNEIADLYAELAKSENQGELDYLGDCRTDIRQMEGVLVKVAALD